MIFRSKILKGCTILDVKLNGIIYNVVDTYNYLGHYITDDLSDDADINRQCRTLFVRGNIILHKCYVFHRCEAYTVVYILFTKVFCSVMVELQKVYCK